MNRIYCVDCDQFLVKLKNGFEVPLGHDGEYFVRGDSYQCPACLRIVYGDFGEPYYKPNKALGKIDSVMRKAGRRLVEK
jgi:hypothetical protein